MPSADYGGCRLCRNQSEGRQRNRVRLPGPDLPLHQKTPVSASAGISGCNDEHRGLNRPKVVNPGRSCWVCRNAIAGRFESGCTLCHTNDHGQLVFQPVSVSIRAREPIKQAISMVRLARAESLRCAAHSFLSHCLACRRYEMPHTADGRSVALQVTTPLRGYGLYRLSLSPPRQRRGSPSRYDKSSVALRHCGFVRARATFLLADHLPPVWPCLYLALLELHTRIRSSWRNETSTRPQLLPLRSWQTHVHATAPDGREECVRELLGHGFQRCRDSQSQHRHCKVPGVR